MIAHVPVNSMSLKWDQLLRPCKVRVIFRETKLVLSLPDVPKGYIARPQRPVSQPSFSFLSLGDTMPATLSVQYLLDYQVADFARGVGNDAVLGEMRLATFQDACLMP
jgi:hypothetical protein